MLVGLCFFWVLFLESSLFSFKICMAAFFYLVSRVCLNQASIARGWPQVQAYLHLHHNRVHNFGRYLDSTYALGFTVAACHFLVTVRVLLSSSFITKIFHNSVQSLNHRSYVHWLQTYTETVLFSTSKPSSQLKTGFSL